MKTKACILIVDDSAGLRKTLSDILSAKGYDPVAVATGKEALVRVNEEAPAIALVDRRLEDMSGLDLMAEIKARSPDTECIVITGYASQASAIEAMNVGAYSYVQKPYDVDHLLLIIRRAIEKREAHRALQWSRQRLEGLHEEARRLAACESEEEAYQIAVRAAERILDFSICTLDIVEDDKLVVKATSSGVPPSASRGRGLDERGLGAKTHRTGRTYVFGSLDEVPEARPTRGDFQSGISAPIDDIGVFQVASTEPDAFSQDDVRLLELLLGHTAAALKRIRLLNKLTELAIHDPLTGVYNRYYLNQTLEREIERSRRYGHPIAFLMIDVNRFKEINDRFGHQMGDRVLQAVASLLVEEVRATDIVVRYGGDEFLIIQPETDGETDTVKERILGRAARLNETNELVDFPLTLSVGAAFWDPQGDESLEEALGEADRRMYEDKRSYQ
ncbi:MAG: diguanylate cyclase domain-containing protein [Anaerolineae bacterium]